MDGRTQLVTGIRLALETFTANCLSQNADDLLAAFPILTVRWGNIVKMFAKLQIEMGKNEIDRWIEDALTGAARGDEG